MIDDGRPFIVKKVEDKMTKNKDFKTVEYTLIQLEAVCFYDDHVQQIRLSTPQVIKKDTSMTNN